MTGFAYVVALLVLSAAAVAGGLVAFSPAKGREDWTHAVARLLAAAIAAACVAAIRGLQ